VVAVPPHGTQCLLAPGLPRRFFQHNCDTFCSWEHSILEASQTRTEESADNIDSNHSEPTIGRAQSWCRGLLEAGDADDPIHEANDPNSVISENTFLYVSPHTISSRIRSNKFMYETLSTIWYMIYLLTAIGLIPSGSSTWVLISSYPDQEGNKLQQQKIVMFIYPICYHNWRNISIIYIYNKTSIKQNILTIKQNTSGSRSG